MENKTREMQNQPGLTWTERNAMKEVAHVLRFLQLCLRQKFSTYVEATLSMITPRMSQTKPIYLGKKILLSIVERQTTY